MPRTKPPPGLSRQLDRVETELAQLRTMLRTFDPALLQEEVSPEWIRAMLQDRRRREALFGPGIFADPAWDILLELYAIKLTGGRASINELCRAAGVPPTTALRWIGQLESAGLLVRVADVVDRRRTFVELSSRALGTMKKYFEKTKTRLPRM